jgi:hypothetical protein
MRDFVPVYLNRGACLKGEGKIDLYVKDYQQACRLGSMKACETVGKR